MNDRGASVSFERGLSDVDDMMMVPTETERAAAAPVPAQDGIGAPLTITPMAVWREN
jgi:hypothetical protein